ncbi:Cellulose binding domain-containing protein [Micromonospora purpureochromogenes]|uniref:Cellulose binding domain-containing protein n=1 Tax=Micromonospora purpureochromogenes TaxID=47872 RepID=A0A1C4ZQM0_9ACTN|nr:cellulose binding domain-containing protein [Micromonospora purpureochromogenes]SCF35182.1 Cellulose binding domain-containing protein [Micromonospora purpureochromogenes]
MPSSPPQPRRTVAVILLDRIVALAGHVRRAIGGLGASSRRTRVLLAASLVVLVATAASVVLVLRTPERLAPVALDPPPDVALPTDPAVGGPDPQARPAASSPAAARRTTAAAGPPVAAAAPPATAPSARTPSAAGSSSPAALRAAFAIEERALFSYGADVTISNAGRTRVTNWTLVITLPRESLEVSSVTGARATREGAIWTFVPDGTTAEVAAESSVQVTFRVSGAPISSTPTACTIDGAACTGLPD